MIGETLILGLAGIFITMILSDLCAKICDQVVRLEKSKLHLEERKYELECSKHNRKAI